MSEPDRVWTPTGGDTFEINGSEGRWEYNSGPIPFDRPLPADPGPGVFWIDYPIMPMDSRLARYGVRGVKQQVTTAGDIKAIVHIRRGLLGWFARRWLKNHPLQLTTKMYRPEWAEWRNVTGKVEVV